MIVIDSNVLARQGQRRDDVEQGSVLKSPSPHSLTIRSLDELERSQTHHRAAHDPRSQETPLLDDGERTTPIDSSSRYGSEEACERVPGQVPTSTLFSTPSASVAETLSALDMSTITPRKADTNPGWWGFPNDVAKDL